MHDHFTIAEVEMYYRAYVESYQRAHHAEDDSCCFTFTFFSGPAERSPHLDEKDGHERKVKCQRGQTPPCGYLDRRGMKMAGRQPPVIIESEFVLEFGLASFAYSENGIASNERERLAPHFQPVSGAAFVKIE
ncbi:MAG TPA: hypothetical protein VID27_18770, partial [Blastocatellia bacterium]